MWNKIMNEAIVLAEAAAKEQFEKLKNNGPKYSVYNADVLSRAPIGDSIGTMLDNCVGAWIEISGRNPLVSWAKKNLSIRMSGQHLEGSNWYLSKGVYKGYTLHLSYPLRCRQEMSIHEEANRAAVEFLRKNGLECHLHSYID